MLELIKRDNLNKEELEKLDCYFSDEHLTELMEVSNEDIIKFIELSEEKLGYSMVKIYLDNFLYSETIDLTCFFDVENLDYCNKVLKLIKYFSFDDFGLAYTIADYYYNEGIKEEALKYYEMIFKKGFNLNTSGYFYSLERYLKLLNQNPSKLLKELIDSTTVSKDCSIDFIDTYLLLIINLEKFSDEYLKYINEAIEVALKVVRPYQEDNKGRNYFSDTDEERDLCELIALKMEYYVYKKDYVKSYELYNELTDEIGRSDCTRYYHARDMFYRQLLKDMSVDYPELKFFDNIGYRKFMVVNDVDKLYVNQKIRLQKENGLTFEFKVINIYDSRIVIAPILPLLGEGGYIFTTLSTEDNKLYLVNELDH